MLPYIGPVKALLASTMFYIGIVQFLLIAVTSYQVSVSPWATQHLPWLTLWIFLGLLLVFVLITLVIEYKFVLPSIYAFGNSQGYVHNSPLVADMQKALRELEEIKAKLGEKRNE